MEESIFYEKQRSHLEESLWYLNQRYRKLQDFRQGNQKLWNDQAAVYINGRYLNPHEEDSKKMYQWLQKHNDTLKLCHSQMDLVSNYGKEVFKLSANIDDLMNTIEKCLQRYHYDYESYINENLKVKEELMEIADLIDQANNVC